jgi:hypothetical protein
LTYEFEILVQLLNLVLDTLEPLISSVDSFADFNVFSSLVSMSYIILMSNIFLSLLVLERSGLFLCGTEKTQGLMLVRQTYHVGHTPSLRTGF